MSPAGPSALGPDDASGVFVLRTPLLPLDALDTWSDGLNAPAAGAKDDSALAEALRADGQALRGRLAALFARPALREAVFIASRDLTAALERAATEADDAADDPRLAQALARYLLRMASRPTPFGLFAGCSVGTVSASTRIELAPFVDYRRHTRIDAETLASLSAAIEAVVSDDSGLTFRPNNTLYPCNDQLRYVESRPEGRGRSCHLVAVDRSVAVIQTLARAANGATIRDLSDPLVGPGVSAENALNFVRLLVARGLLVSGLRPRLTGPEPAEQLIATCESLAGLEPVTAALKAAQTDLAALDELPLGADAGRYGSVANRLAPFLSPADTPCQFQIDLVKPTQACEIGPDIMAELKRAVTLLHRLTPRVPTLLDRFRERFAERYGGREVPLTEALDDDIGIGFTPDGADGAETSPLLAGLSLAAPAETGAKSLTTRDIALLHLVETCLRRGATSIDLAEVDLEPLTSVGPPLPDAFAVMATLLRGEDGERIWVHNVVGPSGAKLLGRFCQVDSRIAELVRQHLRSEEALRPEAVFAEVVCQPQDRLGNVLSRPLLREYEIPYLAESGAPADRQISISDLELSLHGDGLRLRSRAMDREVVPRLSTAHFHGHPSNPSVYRFLTALQGAGTASVLGWHWGGMEAAGFLPRVRHGRLILSPARWLITKVEAEPLRRLRGVALYRAAQALRAARGLPRWVMLAEEDNELPLDLENIVCLECLADLAASDLVLRERLTTPENSRVTGPEGGFAHEIVAPFLRAAAALAEPQPRRSSTTTGPAISRAFAPGSAWLYAKLYSGEAAADRLLQALVRPLARAAVESGAARRWFFIRYADPDPHLRVRLEGAPDRLLAEVLADLHQRAAPFLDVGTLRRVEIGTYEREIERYGGPAGMLAAEAFFHHDSEAVMDLLQDLVGDAGQQDRWRLALIGLDRLLADFGLNPHERLAFAQTARERGAVEFQVGKFTGQALRGRFRPERARLLEWLERAQRADGQAPPHLAIFHRRSQALAPVIAEIDASGAVGDRARSGVIASYAHMFVNRMMRSSQREHELVLFDYLTKLYPSLIARAATRKGASRS